MANKLKKYLSTARSRAAAHILCHQPFFGHIVFAKQYHRRFTDSDIIECRGYKGLAKRMMMELKTAAENNTLHEL